MKKILSLLLALTLFVVAMPISAFADTTSTDDLFGVIIDADGNIVERIPMSKGLYVNSVYTLKPGGRFLSYQYQPSKNFLFGYSTRDEDGNVITSANSKIKTVFLGSDSMNLSREEIYAVEDDINDPNRFLGNSFIYNISPTSYKYLNFQISNTSTKTTSIRIVIIMDSNDPDADQLKYFY